MACDVKQSSAAWNTGIDAFKKSFLLSGDTTKALRYAISEMQEQHPDIDFDPDSFINPLVSSLKQKGMIDKDYDFKKETDKKTEREISKTTEKFSTLNQDQKKTLAKKMFGKLQEQNLLTQDDIQNLYAEAVGIPSMDESTKKLITEASSAVKAYEETDNSIKALYNEITGLKENQDGSLTADQDKDVTERIKTLAIEQQKQKFIANRAQSDLAQKLAEKSFWMWDFADNIRMNLMSPVSLLKNLTGAVIDAGVRQPKNMISGLSSLITNPITTNKTGRIGSRFIGGLMNADKSFKNAMESWKYGRTEFSKDLPSTDYLNVVTSWKKFLDSTGKTKAINAVATLLKVTPDFVKRTLSATDAFFYDNYIRSELNRIASQKGLSGAEKELFMVDPDEESVKIATDRAKDITFKTDSKLSNKLTYNARDHYRRLVKEGMNPTMAKVRTGLSSIGVTIIAPFIKTPINILRISSRYLLPEWELARTIMKASKETDGNEKQQIIADGMAHVAVGAYIRYVSFKAVAAGLVSAGYKDEDEKTRDAVEQRLGGPNRINYSALLRIMVGGDAKHMNGDKSIDLNSAGVLGVVLGTYAHAYNSYSKEDKEDQMQFNKALAHPLDLGKSLATSTLDLTFLSGTNQVFEAMKADQGKTSAYLNSVFTTLFTGIEPSTVQKLSTALVENKKQTFNRDLTLMENVANTLGYKFLFQGANGMKDKYFALAKEGEALKKKDYMLFDNYFGRVLQEEFGVFKSKDIQDTPVAKLLESANTVEKEERSKMFPSSINKKQTLKGRGGSFKAELNDEQHAYLMEKASTMRMIAATPYINSEDFKTDSYEVKAETLKKFYKDGLDSAKKLLVEKYGKENLSIIDKSKEEKSASKKRYGQYKTKKRRQQV